MESERSNWKPTSLWEALELDAGGVVAVVGAGGKSALLHRAAREARERGAALLLSVTTRLATAQEQIADRTARIGAGVGGSPGADSTVPFPAPARGEVVLFAGAKLPKIGKTEGISPEELCVLSKRHARTPLLVEADGAGGADLKVPGPGEPVIPECARLVVAVTGFPALGAGCSEARVHRREALERLAAGGDRVDAKLLGRLLGHRQGCFKGSPPGAGRVWFINQADTPEAMERACAFAEEARSPDHCPLPPDLIVAGSLRSGTLAGMGIFGYSA
ncbi:MAG: selenium cofactor biosynthesis protein YqeC [Alkalispirochaetaceae bacterium]